jgi:rod shape determining protein RodA
MYELKQLFKKLSQIPWSIILIMSFIIFTGLALLYSAAQGNMNPWASKQLIHFAIFLPLMIMISIVNIKIWYRLSYLSYFLVIILLLLIELFGHKAMGAVRWINLGFIRLQPSELMKLCLVLSLARYFHTMSYNNIGKIYYLLIPVAMTLVPFLLIMKQPDLGTAIILLAVAGAMFFATGVSAKKFMVVIICMCALGPVIWHNLYDYQQKRVLNFLSPEKDALGSGYNIIQSKIAIGSGGLWGKGLINGSQSQLDFLPEHQTDFIFTMMAEELGFIYCTAVIIVYGIIIMFGIYTSVNSRHHYGRMVAIGVTSLFFLHILINIAMVMGMMPAVGVPLPLLSYGGTITMTSLIGIGLLINCYIHNNVYIGRQASELL